MGKKAANETKKEDFRFLGQIGRGSSAKVDKVLRKTDGRVCACKEISLDRLKTQKEREQALMEAKIMRNITSPYIVEYLDAFIEKDSLYLVLQFCSSGDLKSFLKAQNQRKAQVLAHRSIWRYFLRIAHGLEYLHSRRILHRDVKSENIFLHGPDEGLRVGDLGLARMLGEGASGASTLVGTPRYLSPEEVRGLAHYNDKCDVWSLGVILYELCSDGHKGPFDHTTKLPDLMRAILELDPPALPKRMAQLEEIMLMLLAKEAEKRPSTAALIAMPSCAEASEKFGVLECRETGANFGAQRMPGTPPPVPESATSLQRWSRIGPLASSAGATSTATGSTSGAARQSGPEVPDGCCSRLGKIMGITNREPERRAGPGLGFKRLAFCEICYAEGAQRNQFGFFFRRHHCRTCGRSVCQAHSPDTRSLPQLGYATPQRICEICSYSAKPRVPES